MQKNNAESKEIVAEFYLAIALQSFNNPVYSS